MKIELETLSLGHFDWVTPNNSAIQLYQFDHGEDGGPLTYNVTLLLWLKSPKNTCDVPIMIETQISDECKQCAAIAGIQMAMSMVGNVYDSVLVFDMDGDQIEELKSSEIMEESEVDNHGE